MKAGDAMWSPAGKHRGENTGTGPIEAVIVELKGNKAPTATIPTSRADVTITPAFDNPRAAGSRPLLSRIFTRADTTHEFDQVVVALAPADISLNVEGKQRRAGRPGTPCSSAAARSTSRRTRAESRWTCSSSPSSSVESKGASGLSPLASVRAFFFFFFFFPPCPCSVPRVGSIHPLAHDAAIALLLRRSRDCDRSEEHLGDSHPGIEP